MLAAEHIVPYVRPIPLFQELTDAEAIDIVRTFTVKKLVAGDVLCRENEPGDGMFIIESGEARVHKKTAQGIEEELARVGPRGVVGELALLDGAPRSASVTVMTAGSAYHVDRAAFVLLRNHLRPAAYKVIRYLARVLCGHLRELNQSIETFYGDPQASLAKMRARQKEISAAFAQRLASRVAGTGEVPRAQSRTRLLSSPRERAALPRYEPLPDRGRVLERTAFLAAVPLLDGLEENDLATLAGVLEEQRVGAGELLCREGAVADHFYVIASGKFAVEKTVAGAAPRTLASLEAGAVFGEVSLIDGKRRSATCRATEPAIVLRCARQDFEVLFNGGKSFAFRFVERVAIDLAERLRNANQRFVGIFSRPSETIAELERLLPEIEGGLEGTTSDGRDLLRMVGYRGNKVPNAR